MTQGPTAILATWCAEAPRDWSAACRDGARRAVLDTLAVMLAGQSEPAVAAVRRGSAGWGSGGCFVVGAAGGMPAPAAALINGTAAHAIDYDDVLEPSMSHPSAALVPALLALAETTGAGAAELLDAYLVGFEVMARLGEAMNLEHYRRGWHTTLSLGSPGVAAACGRLLGLDARRMAMALSLSTSMAGGSKRQFGTAAKPLHAGLAAKNGMIAAQLAAAGLEGIEEAFDGKWGYLEMMAGDAAPGFAGLADRLGAPPAMEQYGVWLKAYPCCASTHRPVDALRRLRTDAADVVRIEALVSGIAAANLRYRVPTTPSEARFSLPYCLAATLEDGSLSMASFTEAAIARSSIAAMIERIEMRVDPELRSDLPVTESSERATLLVSLAGGDTRREVRVVPHGHPDDPLGEDELGAKFLDCARDALPPERAAAALERLQRFEKLNRMEEVTTLLRA
ncbi:MmgE/PrpD family protein [Falsiroseomonas sp.]|uniref:MmgE/PrpD family protein n=1 Tax=Falsiroseomonas sp. TaxID=2870721 RepID=UPI0035694A5E